MSPAQGQSTNNNNKTILTHHEYVRVLHALPMPLAQAASKNYPADTQLTHLANVLYTLPISLGEAPTKTILTHYQCTHYSTAHLANLLDVRKLSPRQLMVRFPVRVLRTHPVINIPDKKQKSRSISGVTRPEVNSGYYGIALAYIGETKRPR